MFSTTMRVELPGFEPEPLLAKQMRYQLRYSPNGGTRENAPHVGPGGLEPPTSSLSGMRSNHLSYGPNPSRCSTQQIERIPVLLD